MMTEPFGDNVSQETIDQRVREWQERLNSLYASIQSWLSNEYGFKIDTSGTVVMNEELMKEYGVSPVNLPTMKIYKHGQKVLTLIPKGLWVVGANGRVDIFGRNDSWMLVDISDRFSPEIKWRLVHPSDRRRLDVFNRDAFYKIVSES